jgi:hypothetical protein
MTAGVLNRLPARSDSPISSMVARMAGDIAPRGIFGKLEMPIYGALGLTGTERSRYNSTLQPLVDRVG